MVNLADISVRDYVTNGVKDVFSTMLSMKVEVLDPTTTVTFEGEKMVGSVGFAGKVMGVININLTCAFAAQIAGTMLGMDPKDLLAGTEVNDVIGEMSNMVGGNLKSHLCDAGLTCALSIPSITRGIKFQIESIEGTSHERFVFKYQDHFVAVDLRMKPGE
ncbi:MAG: chemotaxis protein CheX [Verrucomicrobiae bacterium]|nr:chemotaxis protein CheX [Verrucomicrobiae bacterium]